jgi:CBS domain-containing protein
MRENDIGMLPVVEDTQLVGIVTDRDLVVSVLAVSKDAGDRPVSEAMSSDPVCCKDTHSVAKAVAIMGDAQIERLPVVDQLDRLVGVISVGDIAVNASEVLAGQAVGEICEDRGLSTGTHRIKPRV